MGHPLERRNNYLCYVGAYRNPASRLDFSGRSFAIGLGPVPFVIIPEVAPFHVSAHGRGIDPCLIGSIHVGRFCDIVGWAVPEL